MNGKLKPFERGSYAHISLQEMQERYKNTPGITPDMIEHEYHRLQSAEAWVNDEYEVTLMKNVEMFGVVSGWHLSIKRLDKEPIHDWRDLQTIKNMLVSPDAEAIELYPSESRRVDSANQYHLWVFHTYNDPEQGPQLFPKIPVGWGTRFVTDGLDGTGSKQRDL